MSVIVAHLATTVFYASPHFLVTHGGALTTLPHHLSLSPHHRATLVIFLGYCFFITKKGSISSPLTRHAQRGEHTERQTDTEREHRRLLRNAITEYTVWLYPCHWLAQLSSRPHQGLRQFTIRWRAGRATSLLSARRATTHSGCGNGGSSDETRLWGMCLNFVVTLYHTFWRLIKISKKYPF